MTEAVGRDSVQMINGESVTDRSRRPVFVMGCHRSGTNLLYDTLQSAGGFAVYRGYLPVYEILIPHFGHPRNPTSRRKIVDTLIRSKGFARTGLHTGDLSSELLEHGHTGGDFLRIVMRAVAAHQGVTRWVVYDPDSVLRIDTIKADIPEALFVHIIRDGRDIALSLMKMGGFRPFPWSRQPRGLLETALYWEWIVRNGRRHGKQIPSDYIEIHYEDLVMQPFPTLERLGKFLNHDLDYDRIKTAGVGSLRESNSSFLDEGPATRKHPVNRWKERLTEEDVASLEALVGPCLEESGYALTSTARPRKLSLQWTCLSAAYPWLLNTKLWLKLNTPLGRLADISAFELAEPPEAD